MKPKTLMEVCKESMGELTFTVKNKKFTLAGSTAWVEFFSGLVGDVAWEVEPETEKKAPKRTARRRAGIETIESRNKNLSENTSDPFAAGDEKI